MRYCLLSNFAKLFLFLVTIFAVVQQFAKPVAAENKDVQQQSKKCQQYGHSCLGGHGKRSSNGNGETLSRIVSENANSHFDILRNPLFRNFALNFAQKESAKNDNSQIDSLLSTILDGTDRSAANKLLLWQIISTAIANARAQNIPIYSHSSSQLASALPKNFDSQFRGSKSLLSTPFVSLPLSSSSASSSSQALSSLKPQQQQQQQQRQKNENPLGASKIEIETSAEPSADSSQNLHFFIDKDNNNKNDAKIVRFQKIFDLMHTPKSLSSSFSSPIMFSPTSNLYSSKPADLIYPQRDNRRRRRRRRQAEKI